MSRRVAKGRALLTAMLVQLVLVLGCAQKQEAPVAQEAAPVVAQESADSQVTSVPPMTRASWLEAVKQAHRQADAAHVEGATPEAQLAALAELEEAFEQPSPLSPELAAPVLQDLASRAARLALAAGRPEESRDWAERGLAEFEGQALFRANLLMALADAERKLGHADVAREHLVEALGINQDLLDQELEEP